MSAPKFPLGHIVATPPALNALQKTGQQSWEFIRRHQQGDWGTLSPEDHAENNRSLMSGDRILSAYLLTDGTKLWVITEADRSSTCVLLPEDY